MTDVGPSPDLGAKEELGQGAGDRPDVAPDSAAGKKKEDALPSPTKRGERPGRRRESIALFVVAILVVASVAIVTFVLPSPGVAPYTGQVRTYYIAADEVEWNYTPSGLDQVTGLPFGAEGNGDVLYTEHNAAFLGPTFLKCVYQQYTSSSFSDLEARTAAQAYLGILGPVIYAEVEDTIHVDFKNNCRFPESIHPQGLSYPANSSGLDYNGSGAAQTGGSVPPGGQFNYTWYATPASGPATSGPMREPSVLRIYESGTSELNASDTGLVGPIIISAQGGGNPDGSPAGIGANIVIYENIFNEANSPYFEQNILDHAGSPAAAYANESDPSWQQSLLKYAINGYIFGNMPTVQLPYGKNVLWYLMAEGNDMHSVTWSGGPVAFDAETTDAVGLLPGVTAVAGMDPLSNGTWWVSSGDTDDIAGGMQAMYTVGTPSATSEVSQHRVVGPADGWTAAGEAPATPGAASWVPRPPTTGTASAFVLGPLEGMRWS